MSKLANRKKMNKNCNEISMCGHQSKTETCKYCNDVKQPELSHCRWDGK